MNWAAREGETFGVVMKENTEANEEWNKKVAEAKSAEDFFNLALEECSTEQERQTLILETLTGMYGEAATAYKETNAVVIEANRANEAMAASTAEIGAAVEPLVTKAKTLGASLLGDLTPGLVAVADGFSVSASAGAAAFGDMVAGIAIRVQEAIPSIIRVGVDIIQSLARSLGKNAKTLVGAAKDVVFTVLDSLPELIPDVIEAAGDLLGSFIEAIPDVAKKVFDAIPQIIEAVVKGLANGAKSVVKAIVGLFLPFDEEIDKTIENLSKLNEEIVPFADIVDEYAGQVVDLSNAISRTGSTISELDDEIEGYEDEITRILKEAFSEQQGLREQDIINIQNYNNAIRALNEEKLGVYRDQQLAELRKIMVDISTMDEAQIAQAVGKAEAALSASNESVEEMYADRLIQIENYHKAAGTVGSEAYNADLRNAQAWHNDMLAENQKYYNEAVVIASGAISEQIALNTEAFNALSEAGKAAMDFDDEYFWNPLASVLLSDEDPLENYTSALAKIDRDAVSAFLNLNAQIISEGGKLTEDAKNTAISVLDAFEDIPEDAEDIAHETLVAMAAGLEEYSPVLKNAGNMTTQELINEIYAVLGFGTQDIADPVILNFLEEVGWEEAGRDAAERISDGMLDFVPSIASRFASSLQGKMSLLNVRIGGVVSSITGGVDGSHANGLSYVPYDGYIAELHEGERVLTKSEASRYNNSAFRDIVVNVNGGSFDERSLASMIATEIQTMVDRRDAAYA